MMPWEHAAMGYVAFSLFVHAAYRDSPTAKETLVVVFASILPDLIDKPLAWEFGVFAGGRALGHSIFFAVPLSVAVFVIATSRGVPLLGWAFAIGYLLHLPADVFQSWMTNGELSVQHITWPFNGSHSEHDGVFDGFFGNFEGYVEYFVDGILTGSPDPYAMLLLSMALLTILLWVYDRMPVARETVQYLQRLRS